jgi:hypothetical protein
MKYHEQSILCLTYAEYVACFSVESYNNHKRRGQLIIYGRGGNGSEVLIDYESIPDERKSVILKKYGDPYQYIVKQPLKDWAQINWNRKAFDFYNNTAGKGYKLPSGLNLPEAYRDKYTKAVTYMDGINFYTTDKLALKRDFNINMAAFWAIVADVIKAEEVALPVNETRLKERLSKYKKEGFKSLIEEFRFANDNSKKVKDQDAEDFLMQLIANGNKLDDEIIAGAYNQWAEANGRKTITGAAVGYRRRNNYHEVALARDGKAVTYNTFSKQTQQSRPSSPLMRVDSDDNVLDLYFNETTYVNKRKVRNPWWRPVMYVVIDPFNDYILGYAVGETVTIELIKEAYRNAMAHITDLTGQPHIWHQCKTDKWSIDPALKGELATFLKMGGETIYYPAAVAQSKYIERVFGQPLHKVLKVFPNYSGHNITAKTRINTDALQKLTKDFPDKSRAAKVIEMVINTMRHSIHKETGLSKQQQWLEAFHASAFCKGKAILPERKLELLGQLHAPKDPMRLLATGIKFQVNNVKYHFDIPAALFPQYHNREVQVYYDLNDMSRVLVTDHKGLRFLAEQYLYQPGAIADMKPGHGALLHERNEDKKRIAEKLVDAVQSRTERLDRSKINAESLLQASVLTKAINHKAQKVLTGYTDEAKVISLPVLEKLTRSIYDEM